MQLGEQEAKHEGFKETTAESWEFVAFPLVRQEVRCKGTKEINYTDLHSCLLIVRTPFGG